MNGNLLITSIGRLRRALLLVVALVATGVNAVAVDDIELTTIEFDKVYTLPVMKTAYYQLTAEEDGIVTLYCNSSDVPRPYTTTDFDMDHRYSDNFSYSYDSLFIDNEYWKYSCKVDFGVTAGTTYYLKGWTAMSNQQFLAKMGAAELELVSLEPEQNSIFDITETGQISLTFNYAVNVEKAMLKCGNNNAFELETYSHMAGLTYEIRDTLYLMLQKGIISGGEDMTLTLTGVCAASDASMKYGEDGTLVLHYICPSMPHMIKSESVPEKFLSYWIPGDEDAVATLTFDGDLLTNFTTDKQKASATLSYGDSESGDYYSETLTPTISGKTLTLDFSGKARTNATMNVKGSYGYMTLKVANVRMADGTLAFAPGQGQLGSYSYSIPYEVVTSDVATSFNPEHGSSLANASTVQIYISDKDAITYTGANFTYTVNDEQKSVDIVLSDISVADVQGTDGVMLTITVPEEAKTADNVVVSLTGVQCIDGLEREVSAKYNIVAVLVKDFNPESISPASGEYLTEINTIDLTYDEEVYLSDEAADGVLVYDANNKTVASGKVTKVTGERKVARVELTTPVTADGSYTVKVKEGVIGDKDYNSTGFETGRCNPELSLNYIVNQKIASAEVRTTPEDGSTVTELKYFTIRYVNQANIGPSYNPEYSIYLLNSDGVRVAEGTLDLVKDKDDVLSITLDTIITAPDTYTLEVQDSVIYLGTQYNAEPNEAVSFTYTIAGEKTGNVTSDMTPAEVTPTPETTLAELNELQLNFSSNVVVNPYYDVVVYNRTERTRVYGQMMASKADPSIVLIQLDEPITDAGVYSVVIPAHAIGDAEYGTSGYMTGHTTTAQTYMYEVKAAQTSGVTITPAEGKVESLKDFTIVFDEYEDAVPQNGHGQLLDADGKVVAYTTDEEPSWDQYNLCTFTLDVENAITAEGTYTLVLPEGMFALGSNGANSPEMRFTYTIGGEEPAMDVTITPADGSTVSILNDFTIIFNDYDMATPNPSVTYHGQVLNAADEVVAETTKENYDWDILNLCKFSLDKEITEAGTYRLVLPAAMFVFGESGDVESTALEFTYTVDGTYTGINAVKGDTNAEVGDVYTTSGVKVRKAGESLDGLTKGLYIVNGKKVVIK